MPLSFYILASFTIISAIAAMSLRNLVHCALCLALTFLGVAGLFLQLNAGFLAFAQILVYVGAVAILIVFAILLTRGAEQPQEKWASGLLLSVPLTVVVAAILLNAIFSTKLAVGAPAESPPAVRDLGVALMTSHVIPLEIIGLLLTVALLGAVVLALPERAPELEGQGRTST
jgi:NADH-quinone oxidoreductase subunit J